MPVYPGAPHRRFGTGEASLYFQSVSKVKLFPKGYSKRMLNTIALIRPL
jgi:hypothetical protein